MKKFKKMKVAHDFILYSLPKIHSTPVAQIYKDTLVEVEEDSISQWVHVKVFDISGWMLKSNLKE